jgi:hypothetical protein
MKRRTTKRRKPPVIELPPEAAAEFAAFMEAWCRWVGAAFDEAPPLSPPPKSAEIIPFKKRPK